MAKILLIEDDQSVATAVIDALEFDRHIVECFFNGEEGFERLISFEYDLVLLDWSLPGKAGIEILKDYRARGGNSPIIMLTGRTEMESKLQGFDAGADDYLAKPFNMKELLARTRALLRRPESVNSDLMEAGDVVLNLKTGKVFVKEREVSLLAKEIAVLEFLMRHRGRIFSVNELLDRVWHSESESSEDAVRQCITRLRKKIDKDGENSLITTVKGMGYKID
ncbi:MAG: response regulator transcription factor [Candidatus Obscuribacterales bacterium]|jgi:DNA-binding response OmpR family regulator|nr:response regulator transcription factor [Candidatus Obscuribacterales bacterium]